MSSMEDVFETACEARQIPGAVLVASDKTGNFQYARSFGSHSLNDSDDQPLEQDAIMWLASCTKLMTAIAVLQCVERGQLKLDEDVTNVLSELKDIDVITGVDEASGNLVMKKSTKAITLRLLLSHSSGIVYDAMTPELVMWRKSRGEKPSPGGTVASRFSYPLMFEPGTSWMYGAGADWAGKMVERVNGGMSLESYMKEYIWQPLGIQDMTFFPKRRPEIAARMAGMSVRVTPGDEEAMSYKGPLPPDGMTEPAGGQGVFGCAGDYLKVLRSLLADDEKLLKKESVVELSKPQLTDPSQKALMKLLENPNMNYVLGAGLPMGCMKNWALGGLLNLDNLPGWKNKGTIMWSGMPNLNWFIDREAGLCGMYASQILPPGDPKSTEMITLFERTMYERSVAAKPRI